MPALSINIFSYPIIGGEGTQVDPYDMNFAYSADILELLTSQEASAIEAKVIEHKASSNQDRSIDNFETIARTIELDISNNNYSVKWLLGYEYYMKEYSFDLHRRLFVDEHLLTSTVKAIDFDDITSLSLDSQSAILMMARIGVINGYEDGSFKPYNKVTRAELSKMLSKLNQVAMLVQYRSFSDVSEKDWFYSYVEQAKSRGYINGYTDGSFQPAGNVTFDELSAIIARILEIDHGYYPSNTNPVDVLASSSSSSEWAKYYVGQLYDAEIINGTDAYVGSKAATREDTMLLLSKLYELIYK